jgi:1-deoxy-D-xylulose-5-phosphate synthase
MREGDAVAIIALGSMVAPSLAAAEVLSDEGIAAAVMDARFVKPLDTDLILDLARTCGRVVTVEENATTGGFGSAVIETLGREGLVVPVLPLGLPDRFVEHGKRSDLLAEVGLEPVAIARAVARFVETHAPSLTP